MIEPHSAHEGASAWIWNATFWVPRLSVIGFADPLPFPLAWPFVWPLVVAWPKASDCARTVRASPVAAFGAAAGSGAGSAASAVALAEGGSSAMDEVAVGLPVEEG